MIKTYKKLLPLESKAMWPEAPCKPFEEEMEKRERRREERVKRSLLFAGML